MALIDYRGYRLVCVSILPISSNPSTLRYGSKDAGVNVVASDSVLNRRMKEAAEKLNLKGHMAGTGKCRCFLYGPADIEGHLSFKDKRYYVLDFARGEHSLLLFLLLFFAAAWMFHRFTATQTLLEKSFLQLPRRMSSKPSSTASFAQSLSETITYHSLWMASPDLAIQRMNWITTKKSKKQPTTF
jgi:hypothetical protein